MEVMLRPSDAGIGKPRTSWKETIAKSPYSKAVAEMLEALKRRIDFDTLFEKPLDGVRISSPGWARPSL